MPMSSLEITISLTNEGTEYLLERLPFNHYDSIAPKAYETPEDFVYDVQEVTASKTGRVLRWSGLRRDGAEAQSIYETLHEMKDERLPFQCMEKDDVSAHAPHTTYDVILSENERALLPFVLLARDKEVRIVKRGDPPPYKRISIAMTEVSPRHGAEKETLAMLMSRIADTECVPVVIRSKTTSLRAMGFMSNRVANRNTKDMKHARQMIRSVIDHKIPPSKDHLYETDGIVMLVI